MATVSHGADADRLRGIGAELRAGADQLTDLATSGRAMVQVLAEHWSGADLEHVVDRGWPGAERVIQDSASLVRGMGEAATRNADQQEDASTGDGPGAGTSAGPGAGGPGGGQDDAGQSRPAEDYGELPPEVREAWEGYTREEKEAIIEQILEERADRYGVDEPNLTIEDRGEDSWGMWKEPGWASDGRVVLNEQKIDDPMVLHTVYHEMRHAGQYEAVRDADPFWWFQDPEYNHGMTEEEVSEWEENQENYIPGGEDGYFEQPVEVDAREEGSEFVEGMTPEELDRLLEEAEKGYNGPNPDLPH